MRGIGPIVYLFVFLWLPSVSAADAAPITGGRFGVEGGLVAAEGGVGLGWIAGANYKLLPLVGPVHVRADASYQSHGSDFSMTGVSGNAVLSLGILHGLAGIGWYQRHPGGHDLARQFGIGISQVGGIYLEARWVDVDGQNMIPIVVGIRF